MPGRRIPSYRRYKPKPSGKRPVVHTLDAIGDLTPTWFCQFA
jgi:hypothetical protein